MGSQFRNPPTSGGETDVRGSADLLHLAGLTRPKYR